MSGCENLILRKKRRKKNVYYVEAVKNWIWRSQRQAGYYRRKVKGVTWRKFNKREREWILSFIYSDTTNKFMTNIIGGNVLG